MVTNLPGPSGPCSSNQWQVSCPQPPAFVLSASLGTGGPGEGQPGRPATEEAGVAGSERNPLSSHGSWPSPLPALHSSGVLRFPRSRLTGGAGGAGGAARGEMAATAA